MFAINIWESKAIRETTVVKYKYLLNLGNERGVSVILFFIVW